MSMTDEIKKVVAEGVNAEVTEDEISEVAEVEAEQEVVEAKDDKEEDDKETENDSDEDEEEDVKENDESDEDEEEEDEVTEVQIPKTKAAVINAAVQMLKKAKKDEAQQLFAKMVKMSESEDEGGLVKKGEKAGPGKVATPKAKASKVVEANWDEDLDLIVAEEATLSDGFRDKASAIFEAAYKSKVSAEIDRLEAEYAQNLEEEVNDVQSSLVEKVDSYLNYVVEGWMEQNEVAIEQGLRTEVAEQFMESLQTVFKEHYIEVPEGKADLVDDLADQVAELEEQLNKTTEENIGLFESNNAHVKARIISEQSSGLAATEAEKLSSLVEDIDFDNASTFEMKVNTIKESYFINEVSGTVDEADALIGNDEAPVVSVGVMDAYTKAITKASK